MIAKPLLIVNVKEPGVVRPEPSWTSITKLVVPALDGVPESTPVKEFKDNPVGKGLEVTDQVYEPLPPLA